MTYPVWLPIDPAGLAGGFEAGTVNVPLGTCTDPPKDGRALPNTYEDITFLSRSAALSLGINLGSLSATGEQRVWISEKSIYKDCAASDGSLIRMGASVRLLVHFSALKADVKLTLPLIAAEAQLGNTEARVSLSVLGYIGSIPKDYQIPWQPFNVESYAVIMERAGKVRDLVFSDLQSISPVPLAVPSPVDITDDTMVMAIGRAWALSNISDGRSCSDAKQRLPEQLANTAATDAISQTYAQLLKSKTCDGAKPDPIAQATASQLIGGLRLDPIGFRFPFRPSSS